MKVLKPGSKEKAISQALSVLEKGGLIIYPTETCYGLGADATNSNAVKKLLEFKGQRGGKAVSIAAADRAMAERYVVLNKTAGNLYQEFLPGPLTVVSKSRGRTDKLLEAGQGTLGIRIPDHDLAIRIVKRFGRPITATSANTSGKKPPYCLQDVLKYTSQKRLRLIDLFIDAGKLPFHLPSTVVNTISNQPEVLRGGEIKIKKTKANSFFSSSEAETKRIAQVIFHKHAKFLAKAPLIFALQGELGSGKTQFAKGLGLALKLKDNIVSPTFTIIREYPYSKGFLYHLDTWRLEQGKELLDLGLEEMLKPGNIVVIEWLQKIKGILDKFQKTKKARIIWIELKTLTESKRIINYQS